MLNESSALEQHPQTVLEEVQNHDLIVIGASAGGIEALKCLVSGLPAGLPATIVVIVHVSADSPRMLANILNRASALPCQYASDYEVMRKGHIYLAQPDAHLLVEPARLRVVRGPKENRMRPAIDPLFRAAATFYGPRTIGVILSGNLNDGTAGLLAIKRAGGLAVIQDPSGILYPGMPQSALEAVEVDHIVPLAEMSAVLVTLVHQPVQSQGTPLLPHGQEERSMDREVDKEQLQADKDETTPSTFSCPHCQGVLYEIEDSGFLRFRCRVGHAFTAEVLQAEKTEALEEALWMALRTLEEKVELQGRMAQRAAQQGLELTALRWQKTIPEIERQITTLRQLLYADKE